MVYNISYDLYQPNQKYNELHKLIEIISNGDYSHILDSTFIIKCDKTSDEICTFLSKALDNNDYIFVSQIFKNFYGFVDSKHVDLINSFFDQPFIIALLSLLGFFVSDNCIDVC